MPKHLSHGTDLNKMQLCVQLMCITLSFRPLKYVDVKKSRRFPKWRMWDARQLTKTTRSVFIHVCGIVYLSWRIGIAAITSQSCPRSRLLRLLHQYILFSHILTAENTIRINKGLARRVESGVRWISTSSLAFKTVKASVERVHRVACKLFGL